MKTKMYQINQIFAKENNLPVFFIATQLTETARAVYLFGHGTLESQKIGVCCKCGRPLTHPVSVILGIGPECGEHFWDWNIVGGIDKAPEILEQLKIKIQEFKIDKWFPKTVIKETYECTAEIQSPENHPMTIPQTTKAKTATQVNYQGTDKLGIKIDFSFDMEILGKIKTLQGRKYHGETINKYWTCPVSIENITNLITWGFVLCPKLQEIHQKMSLKTMSVSEISSKINIIPGLQKELFPFQKKGVQFIESRNGRVLIADEMGLGKTAQTLAWLQFHSEKRPVIIVVPSSLKLNWAKEAEMWMKSPKIQILHGTKASLPIIGEIIVINYDILPYWIEKLADITPKVLILDEAHYCKNNSAQRTKAVKILAKKIPHVLALTGTPVVNRPVEIYNILKLINSTGIPSFWQFVHRYCGAKHNGFGWDFSGATNTEELHKILTNTVMLRRLKNEVLTELPDKIYSFVPIPLNNEKEYQSAQNDFIQFLRNNKGEAAAEKASNARTLVEIEGLKQLAVQGKLSQAIEWIQTFLESEKKLVIFANHKFVIDELMTIFSHIAVKIDGTVTGENRQKAVDDFQTNDKIRIFIGNIKAAGVGLTLTAASDVVFLELPWTPSDLTQAEDRCHRIGQKNSVHIHYLLAHNTIEEKIAKLIDSKRQVITKILDGKEMNTKISISELISELI